MYCGGMSGRRLTETRLDDGRYNHTLDDPGGPHILPGRPIH